jgi:hypothetical protein
LRPSNVLEVQISITAFIDEYQPGIVECRLVDAHGKTWIFHEKIPVVTTQDLWTDSQYPQPGLVACTVLERKSDSSGRRIVKIDTSRPWGIESTDGVSVFEVFAEQLEGHYGETDLRPLTPDP